MMNDKEYKNVFVFLFIWPPLRC